MKRFLPVLVLAAATAAATLPATVNAQNALQRADQRRHDDRANAGFSTRRDTTGTDREGYIRYSMSHGSNTRAAQSTDEADRQFSRGNDAYASGQYGSACLAFRHAKNLYARSGDTQMRDASASLASDACTTARQHSSG